MNHIDTTKERLTEVELLGVPGLFTPRHVNRATVPKGVHVYEMQTHVNNWGRPPEIVRRVTRSYFGAVLTASPLPLPEDGCLALSPGDLTMGAQAEHLTIAEFEAKCLPPPACCSIS